MTLELKMIPCLDLLRVQNKTSRQKPLMLCLPSGVVGRFPKSTFSSPIANLRYERICRWSDVLLAASCRIEKWKRSNYGSVRKPATSFVCQCTGKQQQRLDSRRMTGGYTYGNAYERSESRYSAATFGTFVHDPESIALSSLPPAPPLDSQYVTKLKGGV